MISKEIIEKNFIMDVVNATQDTVFVFNPQTGLAIIWNKAFSEISGYSDNEIKSLKAPDSYYSEEDLKKVESASQRVLENGKSTLEMTLITKDGSKIPYEYSGTSLQDPEGNILIVYVGRNISGRKEIEKKLKESENKYREAYNRANFYRDLFAHDINNILHIIGSSMELISHHIRDSEKSKIIQEVENIINNQVERGAKLVSNVHTLSKLEEEEIHAQPTEICELMRKAIEFVKKSYNNRNINISIDCIEEHVIVNANELLQDVFENFLLNAVKYNENSEIFIIIKVSKTELGGPKYNKIELIDNGVGIPNERKYSIFKQDNRKLKGTKGMGLGLSLVNKIIQTFGGKIWVEDKVKGDFTQGSNFVILLPELENI
ncbi:MAG: ATP-binding protein [Promethearchaeota archaeon]